MKDFWSYDKDYILKELNSSEAGLSSQEALDRIDSYGKNVFEEKKSSSDFMIFLSQFKSPITMILIFAAVLSIFLKDYSDAVSYTHLTLPTNREV